MSQDERTSLQLLLAGLAHELNAPLGAIQSNRDVLQRAIQRVNDILADEKVDEEEIEHIRGLVKTIGEVIEIDQIAVKAINDVVAGVRACWRPDPSVLRCVDLHEGLETTLLLLRHELKHRIEVVKEYGDLPPVECYPNQINQVFVNLLLNASQAISGPGTVTVRTYRSGDQVAVEIADSGLGIAPENLGRIFESGFTTKGTKSGMGLGLKICREIVERQGGAIEVESKLGEGSTFKVRLPLKPKATAGQTR